MLDCNGADRKCGEPGTDGANGKGPGRNLQKCGPTAAQKRRVVELAMNNPLQKSLVFIFQAARLAHSYMRPESERACRLEMTLSLFPGMMSRLE